MDCREDDIRKDSMVFYRSWYEALNAYGKKTFCDALKAILEYAFNGTPIESHGLSAKVSALLNTFLPIIDKNIEDYRNGCKGAKYGYRGGRPRKLPESETGGGFENQSPNDTDTGTDNEKETVYVSSESGPDPPHTDIDFYLDIFFFKNVPNPRQETDRFIQYYTSNGWIQSNGLSLDNDEKRKAKAKTWETRSNEKRFNQDFLNFWECAYNAAPPDIKIQMLSDRIKCKWVESINNKPGYHLTCYRRIVEFIERTIIDRNCEIALAMANWLNGKNLFYEILDPPDSGSKPSV